MRTSRLKFGEDVVQQLQLAGSSDELLRVGRLVARVQEEVGVVARLAQVHGSVLQASHGFVIPPDAALHPHITPCRMGPLQGKQSPLMGRLGPLLGKQSPLVGRLGPVLGKQSPLLGNSSPPLGFHASSAIGCA